MNRTSSPNNTLTKSKQREDLSNALTVTINNHSLSATDEDIKMKAVELAIDYLNDIDDEKGGKIWKRFNG